VALLEGVEGAVQLIDKIRVSVIDEAGRLAVVDISVRVSWRKAFLTSS
jgi:hypothetical protein